MPVFPTAKQHKNKNKGQKTNNYVTIGEKLYDYKINERMGLDIVDYLGYRADNC